MFGLYLATAIIGWAFVGLFVFGGLDSDVDFDTDFDSDVDLDTDGDFDQEGTHGTIVSSVASVALSLLSFRSIVFFLAFFGLTGMVLDQLDTSTVAALIGSITVGVFAWFFNSFVFRALKVADVSSTLHERDMRGAVGEVVLPLSPGHRGRISIEVGEQRRYLTAEPFDAAKHTSFDTGESIVVVEMEKGTAKVAPIEIIHS